MYGCLFGTKESKKAALEALPGKIKTPLPVLDNMVPENGWINGRNKPSLADMILYDIVNSPFPGLKALG